LRRRSWTGCGSFAKLDGQTSPAEAGARLVARVTAAAAPSSRRGSNAPAPAAMPGAESKAWASDAVRAHTVAGTALTELLEPLAALVEAPGAEPEPVVVYNRDLRPRTVVRAALAGTLASVLDVTASASPSGVPERPSVVLGRLRAWLAAVRDAAALVDLDPAEVLHSVLGSEAGVTAPRSVSRRFGTFYVSLLADVSRGAAAGTPGALYLEAERSFVLHAASLPCDVEQYTNGHELGALCELLGARGVHEFDSALCGAVADGLRSLGDILQRNAVGLHSLKAEAVGGRWAGACQAALPGGDGPAALQALVAVGNALHLRDVLHAAQAAELGRAAPSTVEWLATLAGGLLGGKEDEVLHAVAGRSALAAQALYVAARPRQQQQQQQQQRRRQQHPDPLLAACCAEAEAVRDAEADGAGGADWELLPMLCAAVLGLPLLWRGVVWNKELGTLTNSGHVVPRAVAMLLAMHAPADDKDAFLEHQHAVFLGTAAAVLLRLEASGAKDVPVKALALVAAAVADLGPLPRSRAEAELSAGFLARARMDLAMGAQVAGAVGELGRVL